MTLEELFQKLSYGDLSNLSMAVEGTGTIKPTARPRLIHYANEALTRLYSRFLLSEGSTEITLVDGTSEYNLPADTLQALEVYDAYGCIVPLNDKNDLRSVFAAGAVLTVPTIPDGATTLQVIYQTKHPTLAISEDLTQVIELPDALHEALTAFIAGKMFGSINTQEALTASMQFIARYEAVCNEAALVGLFSGNPSTGTKFTERGWV